MRQGWEVVIFPLSNPMQYPELHHIMWYRLFLISKTTRITTVVLFQRHPYGCFLFPKQQGLQQNGENGLFHFAVSYFQNNKDYNEKRTWSAFGLLFLISKTTRITTRKLFWKTLQCCFLFPKQQGLQQAFVRWIIQHAVSYFQNNKDYNRTREKVSGWLLFLISKTTRITTKILQQKELHTLFLISKTTRITTFSKFFLWCHMLFITSKTTRITTMADLLCSEWSCFLFPKQQGLQLIFCFFEFGEGCFLFPKQQGLQLDATNAVLREGCFLFPKQQGLQRITNY